jgi:hypothetical protein
MVNYQDSKIYKIFSNMDSSICYVGSTTNINLSRRMAKHRDHYKQWKEGKITKTTSFDLFEQFGVENCIIELIELFPCNSKDELSKKEGEYIRLLNCVNRKIQGRTKKEYYEDNKERRHNNYINNMEKIKEYRFINKDRRSEYNKQYRQDNLKQISERQQKQRQEKNKIKVTCGCGSIITIDAKTRHEKTMKHKQYLESLN